MHVNDLSLWVFFKYFVHLVYSVILAVKLKNVGTNIYISKVRTLREGARWWAYELLHETWDIQVTFSKAS